MASEKLLAMHGINKNILGLQSIFEQSSLRAVSAVAGQPKMLNQFLPASETLKQTGLQAFKDDTASAIAMSRGIIPPQNLLRDMVEKMKLAYALGDITGLIAEQNNLAKNSAVQSLIGNSGFLNQIAKQSPFVSAVQSQMPKIEKIYLVIQMLLRKWLILRLL